MSKKLTIKTLQQQQFAVDAADDDTVSSGTHTSLTFGGTKNKGED